MSQDSRGSLDGSCASGSPKAVVKVLTTSGFPWRPDWGGIFFQGLVNVGRIQFPADCWREWLISLLAIGKRSASFSCLVDLSIWQLILAKASKRNSTRKTEAIVLCNSLWKWHPAIFDVFYVFESSHYGSSHTRLRLFECHLSVCSPYFLSTRTNTRSCILLCIHLSISSSSNDRLYAIALESKWCYSMFFNLSSSLPTKKYFTHFFLTHPPHANLTDILLICVCLYLWASYMNGLFIFQEPTFIPFGKILSPLKNAQGACYRLRLPLFLSVPPLISFVIGKSLNTSEPQLS